MRTEAKPYYISYLRAELSRRCETNAAYSLRAFARDLGCDAGTLSSIISAKRPLSLRLAERMLERLETNGLESRRISNSVATTQKKRPLQRRDPRLRNAPVDSMVNPQVLGPDTFSLIADWYHAAILELTFDSRFLGDAQWIAQRLGIDYNQAKSAFERLQEFGLIHQDTCGKWCKTHDHLELPGADRTSAARRKKQKQIREKAIQSLERDPIESRHMSSITMCIDPDLLPEARRRIEEFNDSLCAFLESSGHRSQVYAMEIGLFSLERNLERKKRNFKSPTERKSVLNESPDRAALALEPLSNFNSQES